MMGRLPSGESRRARRLRQQDEADRHAAQDAVPPVDEATPQSAELPSRSAAYLARVGLGCQAMAIIIHLAMQLGADALPAHAALISFGVALIGFLCFCTALMVNGWAEFSLGILGFLCLFWAVSLGTGLMLFGFSPLVGFSSMLGSFFLGGFLVWLADHRDHKRAQG